MTVKDITADYLKQNGFDGLCCNDFCVGGGCGFADGDLMHLDSANCLVCVPGYRHNVNNECFKCNGYPKCGVDYDVYEYVYCPRKPE